ncbi:MAG TPA: NADH-ubiquinone oxidoreductase-F iron-sulfur binding region domain-containing protein [Pseudonocardiaceae bacterium]
MTSAAVDPAVLGAGPPPNATSPLLGAAAADLGEHQHRSGPIPWRGGSGRLIADVRDAGLTGRGGAGFPTWRKLAGVAAAAAAGGETVLVANAAEGEPASTKDVTLLTRCPHLVLDGVQLAAEAAGARSAYLYAKAGPAADAARFALAQRRAQARDRVPIAVVEAPAGFLAGEESAVVAAIDGRRPVPRDKRTPVYRSGVRGRPTLVQNVETLAHLALIARHGAGWFRRTGTAAEPGTLLATISGAVAAPGVHELPHGIALSAALELAGGATAPLQAVLVGGYHGGWLPMATARHAPLSREGLRPYGCSPGAGVIMALPWSACGLREAAGIVGYLAGQLAGQCGPCRNGLPAIADTLGRLAVPAPDRTAFDRPELDRAATLRRLADLVDGRGACHHPDGTARFARSTLLAFEAEVGLHRNGRCTASRP